MQTITMSVIGKLPDGPALIVRWPGVPAPGPADQALWMAARAVPPGARVFVAGPGATSGALWAARSGAETLCWTDNVAEAESLRATLTHHHFECALPTPDAAHQNAAHQNAAHQNAAHQNAPHRIFVQADFTGITPESCETALLYLPRGRERQVELLRLAGAILRPGGRLIFAGARNEGIKSALKQAQELFGQAGIVAHKGGYHAGLAQRQAGAFPIPELVCDETVVNIDETPAHLIACTGVFAAGRLDEGAASLIAGMRIQPGERVLDLGCGVGVVGLAALRRGAVVTCSDVSARATESTRRTLAANGYPQATVHLACGAAGLPDRGFDTVITNPPFHQGHGVDFEVAQLFVREAARVLRPGGRLFLVANSFLPYAPWLQKSFAKAGVAWENRRFRVWKAEK
ncbi:MAG: class I SAM-dependent methyltransferase [Anaerolineae bacterium]|nr:class I SAM-dependent methyltransferase [Anaerolineae bacterium]